MAVSTGTTPTPPLSNQGSRSSTPLPFLTKRLSSVSLQMQREEELNNACVADLLKQFERCISHTSSEAVYNGVDSWCKSLSDSQCRLITQLTIKGHPLEDLPSSFSRLQNLRTLVIDFTATNGQVVFGFKRLPEVLKEIPSLVDLQVLKAHPIETLAPDFFASLQLLEVFKWTSSIVYGFKTQKTTPSAIFEFI